MFLRNCLLFSALLLSALQLEGAEVDISCITCDSSTDANCIADLTKFTGVAKCTTACFTKVDNGKVTRGCLAETEVANCKGDSTCRSCSDKNDCNKYNICKECDSATDADCSQTNASADKYNVICEATDTKCISNVKTDKNVERRCAASTEKEDTCKSDTCQLCSGGNCNTGYFPTNRIFCYACGTTEGTKCNDVAANSISSKPCRLYDAADKCYTYGTSDTTMERGCVSDVETTNKCGATSPNAACLNCDTGNCNNRPYKRTQTLMCIKCTSTATDDACAWSQTASSAQNCQNQLVYNEEGQCYIQSKDNTVYRGCYYDRDTSLGECNTENKCSSCSDSDGCNSKDEADFTCIHCRSDETPECRNDADKITGTECRNPVTNETKGCYSGIWNGVVIRSCMVDGDERVQNQCKNQASNCQYCAEKDCNTQKASAASISATVSVLLGAIMCIGLLWH